MRTLLLALLLLLPGLAGGAEPPPRAPLHLTDRQATRLAGLRVEIRDLRLGAPGFGRGVDPVLLTDPAWFALQQAQASRVAPHEETGLPAEAFEAWAARTGGICVVTIGGPSSRHDAARAGALMAGVLHPGEDAAPDPARIALRHLDTAALDRFTLDHELGHCRDRRLRVSVLSFLALAGSGPLITESRHAFELLADIVAAIETLRGPAPDAAALLREIANLRQISVVTSFRRGTSGRGGRILLAPSLAYLTAAAIDEVAALGAARGRAWFRALSPPQVVALAEGFRARHAMPRAAQAALTRALADTRSVTDAAGRLRLAFSPELPAAFLARFEAAAAEQRFVPAAHEAPPQGGMPTAWRLAAAPQPLLDGMPWLRAALAPDLRDGATPRGVAPLPDGARRVVLRERDGRRSVVVVRPGGEVVRLDHGGRLASLALDRPAVLRGGAALHILDGAVLPEERAEAWFTGPLGPE
jgi:hypothetical protein